MTARVTVETVDEESRTVAITLPSGRTVVMPVAAGVTNLATIDDGSLATVTYTEVVTMLNLRQKGPGSQEARRDQVLHSLTEGSRAALGNIRAACWRCQLSGAG